MPATTIVDETEVELWFLQGKSYAWMCEEYERRYNLVVVQSTFSDLRSRRGWDRRIVRYDVLIPWNLRKEHRWTYEVALLRLEARHRAGNPVSGADLSRLEAWRARLAAEDLVLDYDGSAGFTYVPRRPGIDLDLIREPESREALRRAAD